MGFRYHTIVIFCLLLIQTSLFPQTHLMEGEMITSEDGLANNMTAAIYKDRKGFIWIGTGYGINKYDGKNFNLFAKETNGLYANSEISRIREDKTGRLWVFYRNSFSMVPSPSSRDTVAAIDIFDPNTEQAIPFDTLFYNQVPFRAGELYLPKIQDPQNRLWLHTTKGELFLYQQDQFHKIFQYKDVFFEYITIDRNDHIWLGWEDNLIVIDSTGALLDEIELPEQIIGIWQGQGKDMFVATHSTIGRHVSLWRKPWHEPLSPFIPKRNEQPILADSTYTFLYLNRQGYWFMKVDDELHLFDYHGNWLNNYTTQMGRSPDITIFDYFEDNHRLWMTASTGIIKVGVRENPFQLIHKKEDMLSDCRSITEDEHGNIYFLNSNIFCWNKQTEKLTKLPDSLGAAFAIIYADSIIWAGNYGVSPMGYDINLSTFKKIYYLPFHQDKFLVHTVAKANDPHRFLVGLNTGIAYLDLHQKKLIPFGGYSPDNEKDQFLEKSEVNFIHKNASGFWLATNHGIFLLSEEKGVIRHFDSSTGELPFDYIRHIHESNDGDFWLATKGGGVVQWKPSLDDRKETSYRQFTTEDGLSDNFTYAVYEDDLGKLWIPSDKGLMQMDKQSLHIRNFTTEDGLSHNEFNHTSHYQAKDGTLYFGGLGGLISFHPKDLVEENHYAPSLEFIRYHVLEEGNDKMLDTTSFLAESGYINIRPQDKFIELHFMLLDFNDIEKHRYAYQIEGYSDSWNYINENFIRITHLPYGDYTLKIKGKSASHDWSEKELHLNIHALRPFYLQAWFLIIMSVLIVILTIGVIRWQYTC
ncbi:MAG: two-component regulator propeller domain-containing protein [Bacteroidia bacterium]